MRCRHCESLVDTLFLDLGSSPPSNAYLTVEQLAMPERWYPLKVYVCANCWLVQTEDYAHFGELFSSDYAYFSSYSSTWLVHARRYADEAASRFELGRGSKVVEVASNDGYLLQYFAEKEIPCLGIEPTASTAAAAREKGIEVVERFFGQELASELAAEGHAADLMAANNVLAHVPDINDFVSGFARLLKPTGVATFEFPHLLCLVEHCQFDTVYHEHFSYLSLTAVASIFARNGLAIFDVEELSTHGGSLRVFAQRADAGSRATSPAVQNLLDREGAAGVRTVGFYTGFQPRAERIKHELLAFLLEVRKSGASIGAYGAAAKGNTLLNFAGVRPDLLPWAVDRNPAKQGKYLPGSRIPVVGEEHLIRQRPDFVLVLPWNLMSEVERQLSYVGDWGGALVRAVPELEVATRKRAARTSKPA